MDNFISWTESAPEGLSTDLLKDLAHEHFTLAGDLGVVPLQFLKRDRLDLLCSYEVDYLTSVGTPNEFYHLRQGLAFFSKLEYLDIGIDKEAAALSTFMKAESLCRETNEIFESWARGEFKFLPRVDSVLSDAARKIALVLGPVPKLSKLGLRFGPGATALTKKRDASTRRKLSDGLACSEDLLPLLPEVLLEIQGWTKEFSPYTFVDGGPLVVSGDCSLLREEYYPCIVVDDGVTTVGVHSRAELSVSIRDETLAFVPKNAKTFRAVSTPPPLNSLVQLGVGDYLKKRLKRFGIDLSDQSLNQGLAKEGSLTGELATLDLSSASDTISSLLVSHLLPVDWVNFLSMSRCSVVKYRGESRIVEKFSGMGNGFTFPLESLIFWALARSCCREDDTVSVYGDDMIVPSYSTPLLKEVLCACGFLLNLSKSFDSGPFRESCGADWYRGFNIRPWYCRKAISPEVLFGLHNHYVRTDQLDQARRVKALIPEHLWLFGPKHLGDGVLHGDWVPGIRKPRHDKLGYRGSLVSMHKHNNLRESFGATAFDMCHASYSVYRRSVEPHCSELPAHKAFSNLGRNYLHYQFLAKQGVPTAEIPFQKGDHLGVKACSIPGTDGSSRVLVYIL